MGMPAGMMPGMVPGMMPGMGLGMPPMAMPGMVPGYPQWQPYFHTPNIGGMGAAGVNSPPVQPGSEGSKDAAAPASI